MNARPSPFPRRRGALVRGVLPVLVCAAAALLLWLRPWDAPPRPARHVVLISIDTLRQDHLGTYGYPRPTSPALDALAARGVTFESAMAQAPYTLASHMTMFTGLHPRAHGVRYIGQTLAEAFPTLAEQLRDAGFRTGAFTDGGLMGHEFGFAQGFEQYHDDRGDGPQGFEKRATQLQEFVREHRDERFFLFMHTFETHAPYVPSEAAKAALKGTTPVVPDGASAIADPIARMRALNYHAYIESRRKYDTLAALIDDYDACIRMVDDRVGEFLGFLEREGLLDDTLVIVTSDHGEAFFDHGLYVGHGLTLYNEEVVVPLIVKFPGDRHAGERVPAVVRLLDLFPTVCAAAGVETPGHVQGLDLEPLVAGEDRAPRPAFGESPNLGDPVIEGPDGVMSYARTGTRKYIDPSRLPPFEVLRRHLDRPGGSETPYDVHGDPFGLKDLDVFVTRLFDLEADPYEHANQAPAHPQDVERARRLVRDFDASCDALRKSFVRDVPIDDDMTEEKLKELIELGYLGGTDAEIKLQQIRRRDAERRAQR